jgi:hypothetical protein
METHSHWKKLTADGRARKYVAVQEFDEALDRYKHAEEVVRVWLLNFAIHLWILRSSFLC